MFQSFIQHVLVRCDAKSVFEIPEKIKLRKVGMPGDLRDIGILKVTFVDVIFPGQQALQGFLFCRSFYRFQFLNGSYIVEFM